MNRKEAMDFMANAHTVAEWNVNRGFVKSSLSEGSQENEKTLRIIDGSGLIVDTLGADLIPEKGDGKRVNHEAMVSVN